MLGVQDGLSTAGSCPLHLSVARSIAAGLLSELLSKERLPDLCLIWDVASPCPALGDRAGTLRDCAGWDAREQVGFYSACC